MERNTDHESGATRRSFLQLALAGIGASAIGPIDRLRAANVTRGSAAQEPFVIVVNLRGGSDGLNTVIPVTLSRYYERRPALAIPETTGLSLATGPTPTSAYRFHPALDGLAGLWADGDVAVVNRVGYPDPNRSHFESEDIWSHAVRGPFGPLAVPESGWIARWAEGAAPDPLGAVSVGMGRPVSFIGGTTNPLLVRRLANFEFEVDWRHQRNHEYRLAIVRKMLDENARQGTAGKNRAALLQGHELADVCQQAVDRYASTVVYPTTSIAGNLRDIAVMLQAGFATRLFYTGMGGFDTHGGQGREIGRQADLLNALDDAIVAFSDDLKAMGIWGHCVIAVTSEFGRRNYENGSGGTDHGAGNCAMLIGGAVRGGMHGPDLTNADLDAADLPYAVDFRSIYKCMLRDHLGTSDLARTFPEAQEIDEVLSLVG